MPTRPVAPVTATLPLEAAAAAAAPTVTLGPVEAVAAACLCLGCRRGVSADPLKKTDLVDLRLVKGVIDAAKATAGRSVVVLLQFENPRNMLHGLL